MLPRRSFQMHAPGFVSSFFLSFPTRTAKNSLSIDIALSYLKPPFLACSGPNFFFTALSALDDLIDVKARKPAVRVVVAQLHRIGHHRTRRRRNILITRINSR
jgi:hypothetical protein